MVKWTRFFAYLLGVVCGGFWIIFGVWEYFQNPSSAEGLIKGAGFGLPILLATFVAFRWLFAGSFLLILHSISTAWVITLSKSAFDVRIFLALTLTLPPLVAGVILFSLWYKVKA